MGGTRASGASLSRGTRRAPFSPGHQRRRTRDEEGDMSRRRRTGLSGTRGDSEEGSSKLRGLSHVCRGGQCRGAGCVWQEILQHFHGKAGWDAEARQLKFSLSCRWLLGGKGVGRGMWAGTALSPKADVTICSLGQDLWQLLVPRQPVFSQEHPVGDPQQSAAPLTSPKNM